jgi:flagellar protein FlaI
MADEISKRLMNISKRLKEEPKKSKKSRSNSKKKAGRKKTPKKAPKKQSRKQKSADKQVRQIKKPIITKAIARKAGIKNPDLKTNLNEKRHKSNVIAPAKGDLVDKYSINLDNAKVTIKINKTEQGVTYNLHVPQIGIATASLLDEVRNELVSVTSISMGEMMDPTAVGKIKERFMKQAVSLLKERIPTLEPNMMEFLVGKLMQDMLGLGEIEFLVNDPNLEEVVIPTSKEPIRVYHKKHGWIKTNLKIGREEDITNYSNIVARRVGRQITVLSPLLDAHLITGDRVNAILYPISTKGNTITIRKFARDPYTIVDLIKNKTMNNDIATLLWLAIEYEMNVLISGGTAAGKTVILNACMPFIPPNNRIISVEDTRELMLPEFLYWTPLVTRTPNPEGKGEVSMLSLLVNSLRMRPDRIVLGEMRRKEEAMVLFEAMHTGHSVYATVHADSATETINRLTNPPLSVPKNLLKAVNLNIVMFRDRKLGARRVLQVAEFQADEVRAEANILYRWVPETDEIVKHAESSRFFEDIGRHTGMSQTELNKDLQEKKRILEWMIKNNIRELNDFGRVMSLYYTNKDDLMDKVRKNQIKAILGRG